MDFAEEFNRFAGKEVKVTPLTRLDNDNPIIDELKQTAKDCGLDIRIWMPNDLGTMDYVLNRVNIDVVNIDNKWRIGKSFSVG